MRAYELYERIDTQGTYETALAAIRSIADSPAGRALRTFTTPEDSRAVRQYHEHYIALRQSLCDALTKIAQQVWDERPWSGKPEWMSLTPPEGERQRGTEKPTVEVYLVNYPTKVSGGIEMNKIKLTIPFYSFNLSRIAKETALVFAHEIIHLRQFVRTPSVDYRQFVPPDYSGIPNYMNKTIVHDDPKAKGRTFNGRTAGEYFGTQIEIQAYAHTVALAIWRELKGRDPKRRRQEAIARLHDHDWMLKHIRSYRRYVESIRPRSRVAWHSFLKQTYLALNAMAPPVTRAEPVLTR